MTPDAQPGLYKIRSNRSLLSVVIPCFNEQDVITLTYDKLVTILEHREFHFQIVLVDDGSRDGTPGVLASLSNRDPRVKVVLLSRNFGHQAAVSAGLANADGDAIAIMDADLQDPPDVVCQMFDKWLQGSDVVYGIRTQRKESLLKRASYKIFYQIFHKLADIDTPIDAGDFSLIDRRVLNVINQLPEKNRFFRGLRAWSGFIQCGIPYERQARVAGSTKYPLAKLIRLASDGVFNFSTVPLNLVFYVGMGMSLLAFSGLLIVLILKIFQIPIFGMRISDVQGFTSTILTILFIGGVQLISTGVLGQYIGRIYHEAKGRPSYIVRSVLARSGSELSIPAESTLIAGREGEAPHSETSVG